MLRIEVAFADRDQLGEGPLWDVDEQRLYWIDFMARPFIGWNRTEPRKPGPCRSLSARSRCAEAAAPSYRCAAAALRSISPPAKPSAFARPNRVNCGPASTTARSTGRVVSSPDRWISKSARRWANCFASIPISLSIRSIGRSFAPTGRAGARTDERSISPTPAAAPSTRTTTIRRPAKCCRDACLRVSRRCGACPTARLSTKRATSGASRSIRAGSSASIL